MAVELQAHKKLVSRSRNLQECYTATQLMLERLINRLQVLNGLQRLNGFRRFNGLRCHPTNVCFCTLAIHPPYRRRAQLLVADAPGVPWIVFTDEPRDFEKLPVRAVHHTPTGPMAIDFRSMPIFGQGRGQPAYHDKRFVLQAALEEFDTAIFVDADTRIRYLPRLPRFPPGIAFAKVLQTTVSDHLQRYGQHRRPAFEQLATELIGDRGALNNAQWCAEALFAVTKDGNEARFFAAWERSASFLQSREVYSGEGGVIGLAALYAGWTVDYGSLTKLAKATQHEGRGPKT